LQRHRRAPAQVFHNRAASLDTAAKALI